MNKHFEAKRSGLDEGPMPKGNATPMANNGPANQKADAQERVPAGPVPMAAESGGTVDKGFWNKADETVGRNAIPMAKKGTGA